MHRLIFPTLVVIMSLPLAPQNAGGETTASTGRTAEFRVKTTLFSGKEEQPAAEHLILFSDSFVYDLPQINNNIVTVYDPVRGRVVLLDRSTQVKSTITTEELVKLTAQLRASADTEKKRKQLGLNAEVQAIVLDPKTNEVAVVKASEASASSELSESSASSEPSEAATSDGFMTSFGDARYEVLTQSPREASIAKLYGQFADLALRLNVIRPIGLPPFPRMELNDRVTAAGQIPRETRLTIRHTLTSDRYRSTHDLVERLSESDRKAIHEVGGMLALYEEVPLKEFPQ